MATSTQTMMRPLSCRLWRTIRRNIDRTAIVRYWAAPATAAMLRVPMQDAQAVMQEKIAEVETNCYETEFAYWEKKK